MAALAAQQAELAVLLGSLRAQDWDLSTRCEGWSVADVVLHLTQTDEMALGSATGRFDEALRRLTGGLASAGSVDEGAALMIGREHGLPVDVLFDRWERNTAALVQALDGMDLSTRVPWVAGQLSARTLATGPAGVEDRALCLLVGRTGPPRTGGVPPDRAGRWSVGRRPGGGGGDHYHRPGLRTMRGGGPAA